MVSPSARVLELEATPTAVKITISGLSDAAAPVAVYEFAPYDEIPSDAAALGAPVWRGAGEADGAENLRVSVPRFDGARDRLYSAFALTMGGQALCGARYVTRLSGIAASEAPYPAAETIKGLQVRLDMVEDAAKLGVRHAAINFNQGDIMLPGPGPDVTEFTMDGRTFYFDEAFLRQFDASLRPLSDQGIIVTLILLNSPNWRRPIHPDLRPTLLHPAFNEEGLISAFNVITPEGLAHYKAFCEFAAQRYGREGGAHGRAAGFIVANEIDSQWVWANAGEMPAEEYLRQYGIALRTAWLAARKAWSQARVYISLDHLWTISHLANPLRTYPSRQCLELLSARTRAEGNYDWAVAFHPYPEDLRFPDFWNDQTATESFDTPRITFKNIEQLPAFLAQPEFLCDGRPRRIILSEQGFNSHNSEQSEAFQAAAYALAYRKIAACPAIDSFILHAHADNLQEFGLNLGLWRIDGEGNVTTPKPVYEVFRDVDGPRGDEVYTAAEPFLARRMNRAEVAKLY